MKTLILIDGDRAFASSDNKKIINRWKRCAENSNTPYLVIEDKVDEFGQEQYSIEIPHGLARKSVLLLIPNIPEAITEGERLAALVKIHDAMQILDKKANNKD